MGNETKLLIGVITYDGERYCRDEFINSLGRLTYSSFDVVFVTNSGGADAQDINVKAARLTKGTVTVLTTDPAECTVPKDIYTLNRERIRSHFLEGNWDYLLFIDSDVFVPTNAIEVMLSHGKELVTGIYLNGCEDKNGKKRILPMLWAANKNGDRVQASIIDVLIPRAFTALEAGLGCCLIARNILEKVGFPWVSKDGMSEDVGFFFRARAAGYLLWADTRLQCLHIKHPLGDGRNRPYDLRNYTLDVKKKA